MRMRVRKILATVAATALWCFGAIHGNPLQASSPKQVPAAAVPGNVPPDGAVPAGQRYKVATDDILTISFALSPELNQTVTIHPDGYISLFNVGSLYVAGMTVPQLDEAIKKAYSGILHEPIIDVDLKDFQKPVFYVMGMVTHPGVYDLRYNISVMQGIAMGGGFTKAAKTQVFLMHRVSTEWAQVKQLNLRKVIHGKQLDNDLLVRPGDLIFVPNKVVEQVQQYIPYGLGLSYSPGGGVIY